MRKACAIAVLMICILCASCSIPAGSGSASQPSASAAGEPGTLGLGTASAPEFSLEASAPQPLPDFEGIQTSLAGSNDTDISYTKCTDLPPETMGGVDFLMKQKRPGEYEYVISSAITMEQYDSVIGYLKSTYGDPTVVDETRGNPYLIWANEEASSGAWGMFLMRVYLMTLNDDTYSMGLNIKKP